MAFREWLFRLILPRRGRVEDVWYIRDGGTTILFIRGYLDLVLEIVLSQHRFDQGPNARFGPPGRLSVGDFLVPFRGPLEKRVVNLLKVCLVNAEARLLRVRKWHPETEAWAAWRLAKGGAVIFGSKDLAYLHCVVPAEQVVHHLRQVISYVESDEYGTVTD
jgi:hypothetical protein